MSKFLAIYNANNDLAAVFVLDDHELIPTQRMAAREYMREFLNEYAYTREFDRFEDLL